MKDDIAASQSLPNIPEGSKPQHSTKDSKAHGSFRKRLSVYTGGHMKTDNASERSSVNSISGLRSFRRLSSRPGSILVQAANQTSSRISRAASVRSSLTQRSSGSHGIISSMMRPASGIGPLLPV